jgi:hypothetical protein
MAIDGAITLQTNLNDRRTVGVNATSVNIPANLSPSATFSDGAGALQGNVLYQASLALTAGTFNLDLNGVVTDPWGTTVAMLRVKGILVFNTGATSLVVGAGTNPWLTLLNSTGTITLPPGAAFAAFTPDAAGWAVTAATGDILKFAGTGTATFQVIVLGASS